MSRYYNCMGTHSLSSSTRSMGVVPLQDLLSECELLALAMLLVDICWTPLGLNSPCFLQHPTTLTSLYIYNIPTTQRYQSSSSMHLRAVCISASNTALHTFRDIRHDHHSKGASQEQQSSSALHALEMAIESLTRLAITSQKALEQICLPKFVLFVEIKSIQGKHDNKTLSRNF